MPEKIRCFVIMPFTDSSEEHTQEHWTDFFESFLKPLIEECPNVEAYRSEALRVDILNQIITDLVVTPIVVADLTDYNPNVYWELGVRQSFKHGTITIAEEGTELPYDLSKKGTLFYNLDDVIKNTKFRQDFKNAINDCISHPDKPDSHVLETLSGRGTLYQIINHDETLRRMEALISECNRNTHILNKIFEDIEHNKKNPENTRWESEKFSISAIELLLTNRYLNEDSSFYSHLHSYFGHFMAINENLLKWTTSRTLIENWFLKNKDLLLKIITKHKEMLSEVQTKLIERKY
jgi:hypothetical protein